MVGDKINSQPPSNSAVPVRPYFEIGPFVIGRRLEEVVEPVAEGFRSSPQETPSRSEEAFSFRVERKLIYGGRDDPLVDPNVQAIFEEAKGGVEFMQVAHVTIIKYGLARRIIEARPEASIWETMDEVRRVADQQLPPRQYGHIADAKQVGNRQRPHVGLSLDGITRERLARDREKICAHFGVNPSVDAFEPHITLFSPPSPEAAEDFVRRLSAIVKPPKDEADGSPDERASAFQRKTLALGETSVMLQTRPPKAGSRS